ncbi:sugar-binding domain-containing protein [Ferruginibacter sp. SUN106]|uniref:sugar-binding domain-containing protein n=1 Tax=Ferruginibacter sp. SUN106 TaxID=2978348 RepID=UPI003D369F3F
MVILLCHVLHAQVRQTINFDNDWKFYLGNDSTASNENYNDASWRNLNLPHDWSIEGKFSKDHPATNQGGALPGGIGWYRKTFTLPLSSKEKNITIEFDGVYRNSEVWINGHYLGKRPNGYISFQYDLTPYLKFGKDKNVIAVKVDNSQQPNSRWYSGSGIYRDVRLIIKSDFQIDEKSLFITTPIVSKDSATINVKGVFKSPVAHYLALKIRTIVLSANNEEVYSEITGLGNVNNAGGINSNFSIKTPLFWSMDNPILYKLKLELLSLRSEILDSITTTFGIRSFHFDNKKGFFLNNQPLKIKGVCMHHDLGALGAAFNYRAAERQLQILKTMGCNAIRTAHNPPAPEFLDLCDKMGFLVMDEAFDMWQKKKNKFDYSKDFKDWYKKDLEDMVLRDRNHPSIFMWSIGNEIREQFDSAGKTMAKELVDIVKHIDPTRPVTSAMTEIFLEKNFIAQSNALDVFGFNYKDYDYDSLPQRFPGQQFIASETVSGLATRGVYQFPSDTNRIWPPNYKVQDTFTGNKDLTCAAYDNTYAYWGNTHEKAWLAVKKRDFIAGTFVWSGFDFLGEPVPYQWPARSAYYGIVDLAGFPKDVYYMYQSEWTTKPVLHIFPHWSWKAGDTVDVWAYYNNADEVELFLNGKSLGTRKKTTEALHVMWRVPFAPGTVKAISKKNGKIVLIKEIKTAGAPAKIELTADRKIIHANGKDLSFIMARIVDKDGNVVPGANNLITFSIAGNANIAATDNGYQADTASFSSPQRRAWKGMALAIVRSSAKKGNSTLTAKAPGLISGTIALKIAE